MADIRESIERARDGDRGAFSSLVGPLVEPGCQLAFSYLHDWNEAEDVVQEACLKAWRAIDRLHDHTVSIRPWFLTIVANEARSRRRSRWFSVIRLATPPEATSGVSIDEAVTLKADLGAAMRRLSETQRTILFLHFYLDLSLEEVGRILGLSTQAVKARLYRATRSLRPALAVQEVGS